MKIGLSVFELDKNGEDNMSQVIDILYKMKTNGAHLERQKVIQAYTKRVTKL